MKNKKLKKTLVIAASVFVLLAMVLCVHIYMVTRPKAPGPQDLVMARIDFKQNISGEDGNKISAWLYGQRGVDHVVCNPAGKLVVFTFHPATTSANYLAQRLVTELSYKANRYMPSEEEMMKGCPAMANSITSRVYNFFKSI